MPSIKPVRALLFDLDGTLLDTIQDLAASMNLSLAALGFPEHPVASYKTFVGDGITQLAIRALPPEARDEATVNQCVALMRLHYERMWADTTAPYPGIHEMLEALTQKGLSLSILSNKPHEFTVKTVERFLSRFTFHPVWGARPGIPTKPDPTAALEVAAVLGLTPGEVLYLGDSGVDMKTARAAGMTPLGATWGFREASELEAAGAETLVDSPLDVLRFLS